MTNVVPQIIFPLLQNRLLLAGASSCNVSGHLIFNDERMHHYQRGRAWIAGFGL